MAAPNETEFGRGINQITAVATTEASSVASAAGGFLRRERIGAATPYIAPGTDTERRLAALWQELLHVDKIGTRDDFFAFGGDSLQAVLLFQRILQAFGVTLAPATIIDRPTVGQLAPLLAAARRPDADPCLVTLQAEGAEPAWFFVHAAGGNVFSYRALVHRLGNRRKLFGLVYPDQDKDPIPALTIPEMAAVYVESIKRAQPTGPYFVLGYSLGGNIAYEIARLLRARGERIGLLVLVDSGTPDGLTRGLQRTARKIAGHLATLSNEPPSAWPRYLWHRISKEASTKYEKTRGLAALRKPPPPATPRNLRVLMTNTLATAQANHVPLPYDGPIKLFRCIQGGGARWSLQHQGWGPLALGGLEIYELPTGHYEAISEPTVVLVAAYLERWMDEAAAR